GPAFMHRPHRDHPIKTLVRPTNPLIGKRMASKEQAETVFEICRFLVRLRSLSRLWGTIGVGIRLI
ncbi:hypothetical protein, partial [Streptomyces mirabilis]|uniref:hypothetical protein n=1 Tax=Streptomyces mirabilis TaxID=68239 RepID=UPI003673B931